MGCGASASRPLSSRFPHEARARNALFLVSCITSLDAATVKWINQKSPKEVEEGARGQEWLDHHRHHASLEYTNAQRMIRELEVSGAALGLGVEELLGGAVASHTPLMRDHCTAPLLSHFQLRLKESLGSESEEWLEHYRHYASLTRYGVLIVAGRLEWFLAWRASRACLEEVRRVPDGRLFVYLQDENGKGVIVRAASRDTPTPLPSVSSGSGYAVWAGGDIYQGPFRDAKRHGDHGTLLYASGAQYEGAWCDNKKHGAKGRELYADGAQYEGPFCEDKRHGEKCRYVYPDGARYEGPFSEGKRHGGYGKIVFADGGWYEGPWREDEKHGESCRYVDGKGNRYEGPYRSGQKHGQHGTFFYDDGGLYEGPWREDKRHGSPCKMFFAGGDRYEGPYRDDRRHGQNCMVFYADGRRWRGPVWDDVLGEGEFV